MNKALKPLKLIVLSVIISVSSTSCALMFQGSRKNVTIRSMTEGAKIYVNGELKGADAINIKLKRNSDHTVMIKKDGYKTQTVSIRSDVQPGWIVFDALINWGAFLTDPTTGAWNNLEPSNITVDLEKN